MYISWTGGHDRPWPTMADHGWSWPVMAAVIAAVMACAIFVVHGRDHGRPCTLS